MRGQRPAGLNKSPVHALESPDIEEFVDEAVDTASILNHNQFFGE